MNIVITGSIAFDYLMNFPGNFLEHIKPDRLQKLSLSFLVDEMVKQYGGCAPNIAYSLALLGERPVVMGTAGQDFASYREWLESNGVDTSAVKVIPNLFTASFFCNTDAEQNQIASFYTGAMAHARDLSFSGLAEPADLTIISANDPDAMERYAEQCRQMRIPFIYDPSQQVVRSTPESLSKSVVGADILIVNDYEYELLKDRTGMDDDTIRATVKRAVIVTLGADGVVIWADGDETRVPALTVDQVTDPTGVGDAFRAGLMKGLALGLPWQACGRMGNVAAAFVLETRGPQTHSYAMAEYIERYVVTFGEDEATSALRAEIA